MNSKWFIIGFVMVALGIFGYISADHQSSNAKIGLLSGHNSIKDYQASGQAKEISMGFGILGGLLCLAGLAMSEEPKKPQRESWEEWDDDDFMKDDDEKDLDSIIVQPKKDDEN